MGIRGEVAKQFDLARGLPLVAERCRCGVVVILDDFSWVDGNLVTVSPYRIASSDSRVERVEERVVQERVVEEQGAEELPANKYVTRHDVFTRDCIVTIPATTSKPEVLKRLVRSLVNSRRLDRRLRRSVTQRLIEREAYATSGIGRGLAFPHLRTRFIDRFIGAIGVSDGGLQFDSLDQRPTKLVFLLLSPINRREEHIRLISYLVSLMRDKVIGLYLQQAYDPGEVYQYLMGLDDQMLHQADSRPSGPARGRQYDTKRQND